MNFPNDRRYTETHEWVKVEGDYILVGITEDAQDQLGDMVYVGDVEVGAHLNAGDTAGVVESVKAASDVYAPVSGEVIAFNEALEADPALVNADAYANWIYKFKPDNMADIEQLLDAEAYAKTA